MQAAHRFSVSSAGTRRFQDGFTHIHLAPPNLVTRADHGCHVEREEHDPRGEADHGVIGPLPHRRAQPVHHGVAAQVDFDGKI